MAGLTVALPVHRAAEALPAAVRCITGQTLRDLEIILILNGSDGATCDVAHSLAGDDDRIRIIDRPEANLAAALNHAIAEARFELIARMDADDLCPPERLEVQARAMRERPSLAAVGSAWELIDASGRTITTVRPPCDPGRLRWRLLLGNILAHGSMVLRREAVRGARGYDERLARAQDYGLWLRLGGQIGCVPEVLYRHRTRHPDDPARSTREQAAIAAPLMLAAWEGLAPERDGAGLAAAIEASLARDGRGGDALEGRLDRHPSREALLAWLWSQWNAPPAPRRAIEAARRSRLREVGAELRSAGVGCLYLWGAGDHTRWALEHRSEIGIPIGGVVDDAPGERRVCEFAVAAPSVLRAGDHVLISSDWHEEAIWESSRGARQRGVRVWRLYA